MLVTEELVELLLATRFWPNLAKDRELQVRAEDGFVAVSYGGEDLFLFGCNEGRLTCQTRPRLVPVHPSIFSVRRQETWLPLQITQDGEVCFEVRPEAIELGDASPERILAYKEMVQKCGLWEWRRLLVEFASNPENEVLADKVSASCGAKLADYAVRDSAGSSAGLIKLVDVARFRESSAWFVEHIDRCFANAKCFELEISQSVNLAIELRKRLGVADNDVDAWHPITSVLPHINVYVGNCTQEQAIQIQERSGAWSWLPKSADGGQYSVKPYWRNSVSV